MTPGLQDVCGAALATNAVTVNGGLADRHGEYFHRQISVANTNQPVWQNVTNIAGTFTNKGGSVFPANGQMLAYDADGNLSFDGIWTYQWDGENRLVAMWMTNGIANLAPTNRLRLDFAYDYLGRRVQKIVSTWGTTNFAAQSTNRFIYDGWNLLAIVNPSSSILQSFMWGKDLGGSLQSAGGVGGLLMANCFGTNRFVAYDGNGNISSLINATDKSLAARYEYSPYGELLRVTGQFTRQNVFRFSTKYWDEESGLVYYGYRYFRPSSGSWLSKDPSQEDGGVNLYSFVWNSPLMSWDSSGLHSGDPWPTDVPNWFREVLHMAKQKGDVDVGADGNVSNKDVRAFYEEMKEAHPGGKKEMLQKYGNKRGSRGTEGYVNRRFLAAGAVVTAATIAVVYFSAKMDLANARENLANGIRPDAGSAEANLYDFVRHADSGDSAWAELDAITYVIASGQTGEGALVAWKAITDAITE